MLSSERVVGSLATIGLTVAVSLWTYWKEKRKTQALQEWLTAAETALTTLTEAEQAIAQQTADLRATRGSLDLAQVISERDGANASMQRLEKEIETIQGCLEDTKQELQKLHADKHAVDQLIPAIRLDTAEKAQSLQECTQKVDRAEQLYNQTVQDELRRLLESINHGAGKEAVIATEKAHNTFLAKKSPGEVDLARDAKDVVMKALDSENVPAEERLVLENRKIQLAQNLAEVARERTEFEEKAARLLRFPY